MIVQAASFFLQLSGLRLGVASASFCWAIFSPILSRPLGLLFRFASRLRGCLSRRAPLASRGLIRGATRSLHLGESRRWF